MATSPSPADPSAEVTFDEPRLDLQVPRELSTGDLAQLIADQHAEGLRFTSETLAEADLTGAGLVECELVDVVMDEVTMTGATVAESRLVRLSSPHLAAARSTWRSVEILSSRIGVAELYDAGLTEVRLAGSKVDLMNLRGATVGDVVLQGCVVEELDLGGASLRRVRLEDCDVRTLDLTGADLEHVDLRGARLSRLVGLSGLRGATVSPEQLLELAPSLAEHLGVYVKA